MKNILWRDYMVTERGVGRRSEWHVKQGIVGRDVQADGIVRDGIRRGLGGSPVSDWEVESSYPNGKDDCQLC